MTISSIMKIFILFVSSVVQFSLVTSQNKVDISYIITHPELFEKYNFQSGWKSSFDYPYGNAKLCELIGQAPLFVPSDKLYKYSSWLSDRRYPAKAKSSYSDKFLQVIFKDTPRIVYGQDYMKREDIVDLLICKIAESEVYVANNSNFKNGFIIFHPRDDSYFLSVVIAPLQLKPIYGEEVKSVFSGIIKDKVENYALNEVEESFFSQSWFDKAQLCVSLILLEYKLQYRNIELEISADSILNISIIFFENRIKVLSCNFKRHEVTVPLTNFHIFPNPNNKNEIFALYSNLDSYVKAYSLPIESKN